MKRFVFLCALAVSSLSVPAEAQISQSISSIGVGNTTIMGGALPGTHVSALCLLMNPTYPRFYGSVNLANLSVSTTATGTSGTNTVTVASSTGIAIGQIVAATGVPQGSQVTAISGTTITLSNNLTANLSATAITFTDNALGWFRIVETAVPDQFEIVSTGGTVPSGTYAGTLVATQDSVTNASQKFEQKITFTAVAP